MEREALLDLFRYHAPSPDMIRRFDAVRSAVETAAVAINENVPPGADRTAAMRKLKEAQMTANAGIVLDGVSYR